VESDKEVYNFLASKRTTNESTKLFQLSMKYRIHIDAITELASGITIHDLFNIILLLINIIDSTATTQKSYNL